MNKEFQISVAKQHTSSAAEPQRIRILLGRDVLTQLIRPGASQSDDCLEAPPLPFAFWLIDNWWRIRWEPEPIEHTNLEWELVHHLSSIGAGYPWPRVSIWGLGHLIGVEVHDDSLNLEQTLRFTAKPQIQYVHASSFEEAVDSFIGEVLDRFGGDLDGLDSEYQTLLSERADPDKTAWRKFEALLGYDPDDAPPEQVGIFENIVKQYGAESVEEVALVTPSKEDPTVIMENCISAAKKSKVFITETAQLPHVTINEASPEPPWSMALKAAAEYRDHLYMPAGPIRNTRLGEVVGVDSRYLSAKRAAIVDIPFAVRVRERSGSGSHVALRTKWSTSRRFELCRCIGDVVWSQNDSFGPLTDAKSARQKFQRAFAQEFLCPFSDLQEYINTLKPDADDIQAAARHFHVSERLIQTVLVNNNDLSQQSFDQLVDAT